MEIEISNHIQYQKYAKIIRQTCKQNSVCAVKCLDFGTKIVRVLCHAPEIVLFLEQQLAFVLKNDADHFDETIVFWCEKDIQKLANMLDDRFNPKINLRLRIENLLSGRKHPDIKIMDHKFSNHLPVITLSVSGDFVEMYDIQNHFCYYAVTKLEPEEFIKHGHLFIQQLNTILKTKDVNLTHGAVFGYNGQGVLLCARGQMGKSTLTVYSMLNGCEYVSDDYQLLEKTKQELYSYPIYSIITLSPEMCKKMPQNFEGKFCSRNGRKDKLVFNISSYHDQFKTHYPIKLCLFPEIVPDKRPSIVPCTSFEKGRAITQFIHSTVSQTRDLNDHSTIRKLFNMVQSLPFYKINLSSNIAQNTECLRQFLTKKHRPAIKQKISRWLLDITFDLATILDTKTNTFYSFNKFSTQVFEMLLNGVPVTQIKNWLKTVKPKYPEIMDDFAVFMGALSRERLLSILTENCSTKTDLCLDFIKECGYKLSLVKYNEDSVCDLVQGTKGK